MAQIHALTPEGRLPSKAQEHVREMVPHPIQDIDTATDWVQAEVDETGQLARAIDSQGRTWLRLHPDTPGVVDPAVADQIQSIDSDGWLWAVADETGQVSLGVRADGTPYAGGESLTQPYDVVLLVGQSNMQGRGAPGINHDNTGIDQYPAANRPQTGIIPATEPLQHPGALTPTRPNGLGIPFARAYMQANPGRRVLLVPAAFGATGFSSAGPNTWDWTVGSDNLAARAVEQTLAALSAAGDGARLAGILWHQGEGDSSIAGQYADKLDGLIAYFRAELSAPDVPVVVGQMSPDRAGGAGGVTIDAAHQMTPARVERTAFAPTPPGLHNPGDTTHLSTRALDIIGARFAEALQRAGFNLAGVGPVGVENLTATRSGDTVTVTWDPAWSRVTDYLIEWREGGGAWASTGVDHSPALATTAHITTPSPVEIRVTSVNADGASTPVTTRAAGSAASGTADVSIQAMADWRTDVNTSIQAHRSGDVVTVTAWRLAVIDGTTGTVAAYEIPEGFRPPGLYDSSVLDSRGNQARLTSSNIVNVTNPSSAVSHHTFTYVTTDPFPA